MPKTWMESLSSYAYRFDLRAFEDAVEFPGWFEAESATGDRASTMAFEDHFRRYAPEALEAWIEVIYWKVCFDARNRDRLTQTLAAQLYETGSSPESLWRACQRYIKNPSQKRLAEFKDLLGIKSANIALVLTFPAFARPDWYPMLDSRVVQWVEACMDEHNAADSSGPQLMQPPFGRAKSPRLTAKGFEFVESWYRWCWYTSRKLTARTDLEWRSRDVEMAVFTAWGKREPRPNLKLNPLPGRR